MTSYKGSNLQKMVGNETDHIHVQVKCPVVNIIALQIPLHVQQHFIFINSLKQSTVYDKINTQCIEQLTHWTRNTNPTLRNHNNC